MKKQIKILTDSDIIVNRGAELLDTFGISCLIKNNVESARLAGFGTSYNDVELWIDETDLEKAQKILSQLN